MLKRLPPLIMCFFLTVALLIFLAPMFLNFQQVKAKLITRLETASGYEIAADNLNWSWFPLPHISLENVNFATENGQVRIPETQIFPDWHLIFNQKVRIGKIVLQSPAITIDTLPAGGKSTLPQNLPKLKFVINNGSIKFAANLLPAIITPGSARIDNIRAEINTNATHADIKLIGTTPFSKTLSIKGWLDIVKMRYKVNYGIKDLKLHKTIPSLAGGRFTPIDSLANLTGHVQGTGFENIKATIMGELPCFVIEPEGKKSLIKCGTASLLFSKNGPNFELDIKDLELEQPGLTLSGKIKKTISYNDDAQATPIWLIDLAGHNLDLSAIRETLLALWGENNVIKLVADIVKGGIAKRANYYFNGPVSDFQHLSKMAITVDVGSATIDVPFTKLHLTEAKGPIKIVDGNLSGFGLSANLASNHGTNGALFLDLTNQTNAFMLELDLDIDVGDLPPVLLDLVKHKKFRRELKKFSQVSGKATGHLRLGNTLHNIEAHIRVDKMQADGRYKRISWPIEINGGTLNISPNKAVWTGLKGTLGPNTIRKSDGQVTWQKKTYLDISTFTGWIDSAALFRELGKNSALPKSISQAISSIEGRIKVQSAYLKGPASKPEKWRYKFDLTAKGFKWNSPLLSATVLMEKGAAFFTDKYISFKDCKVWVREQPLLISGDIKHKRLKDWQGWLSLDGTVRQQLANLIRKKQWVPDAYFPKIPCTLKQFKISWDEGSSAFNGEIRAGMGGNNAPKAIIDIKNNHNRLLIKELSFVDGSQRGRLNVDYWNVFPKNMLLTWQGFLNRRTTGALLEKNIFKMDKIEGDFSLNLADDPSSTFLKGWVKAKNSNWPWPSDFKGIKIIDLDLSGTSDKKVLIKKLNLAVEGKALSIWGEAATNISGIKLNLNVDSKDFSMLTINRLLANLRKHLSAKTKTPTSEESTAPAAWGVKGNIAFNFDHFQGARKKTTVAKEASTFIWAPARGDISLISSDEYTLNIKSSNLCGMDINATLNSSAKIGENLLNVFTHSDAPPRFEKVLPCLDWENSLIEGDLHIDANIIGRGDKWNSGKVDIYSFKGNIKKMTTLSRVFSVINVTDLFTKEGLPDLGKKGLSYTKLDIKSHIVDNQLIIDRGILEGNGLNLFTKGKLDLDKQTVDGTLLVAPLKTLDAIITNVPIFGKVIGGENAALIAIPVSIKGPVKNPDIEIMAPQAVGKSLLNIVTTTIKLPFAIFNPLLK